MLIQSDDDWKAQAQREKEKLAEKARAQAAEKEAKAAAAAKPASSGALPQQQGRGVDASSFNGLLQSLATQSLMMMGAIADPRSGRTMQDLGYAKALLDSVVMLEEKTKGNLTADEANALASTLYELRDTYVRAAWAARSTAPQQAA